jgi:hypothetical protein
MFFQFILCKVIMISWIKFVFSISIFNIEYVRNGALHFFLFFFMNLSWSHDLDGGFNILIWIDLSCFFIIFLIDFFSISSFNVGLVRNWLCNFFFSMELSRSYNSSYRFGRLSWVESSSSSYLFLFYFLILFFNIELIRKLFL